MTKVNKSLTGEAIVAGENNSEIINEQTGSAQVINQENDSIKTKETNSLDSIELEVETCETASVCCTEENEVVTIAKNRDAELIVPRDIYDDQNGFVRTKHLYDDTFIEIDLQAEEDEVSKKLKELKNMDIQKLFSKDPEFFTGGIDPEDMILRENNKKFNEETFGTEIDFEEPRIRDKGFNNWRYIEMLPEPVWYVSVYDFDPKAPRYSLLNSLPSALLDLRRPDGSIHAKLVFDSSFDYEYSTMIDFKTVNDVLTEIKRAHWIMYATLGNDIPDEAYLPYGICRHDIISLRIERLYFDFKNKEVIASIGT